MTPLKPSVIEPVYKSILRWTTDLIEELNATGQYPALEYQPWESRSDENTLPQKTLLGIDGFSFDENDGRWLVAFAFGLSSYRDENLLSEVELLDALHRRTGKGSKIPLLEMELGEQINELVVTDWQLLPMAQSELRNYRTVGVEVKRTGLD